jgi:hypothetical protein
MLLFYSIFVNVEVFVTIAERVEKCFVGNAVVISKLFISGIENGRYL